MSGGSFFSTPSPEFIVGRFLMVAILTGARWCLSGVLICISQRHQNCPGEVSGVSSFRLPCGSSVKKPSASAGDTSSVPGLRRSHMPQSNWVRAPQPLSPRAAAAEAHVLQDPRSTPREISAMGSLRAALQSNPCSPQLEKSLRSSEDPAQPKIKTFLKKERKNKNIIIQTSLQTFSVGLCAYLGSRTSGIYLMKANEVSHLINS